MKGEGPIPARLAFTGGGDQAPSSEHPSEVLVSARGREWRIRVLGRAQAGRASVSKVPLIHVAVEDPEHGVRVLEATVVASSIESLDAAWLEPRLPTEASTPDD